MHFYVPIACPETVTNMFNSKYCLKSSRILPEVTFKHSAGIFIPKLQVSPCRPVAEIQDRTEAVRGQYAYNVEPAGVYTPPYTHSVSAKNDDILQSPVAHKIYGEIII